MTDTEYETDILVVGSGAAAMTAAVTAADLGVEVLMAEKASVFGGTSAMSGGVLWVPASHLALSQGHTDSEEEAEAYIAALAGDEADRGMIRAFVKNAPKMLKYLGEKTGIKYDPIPYTDYHAEQPGGKLGYRSHNPESMDGRVLGEQLELLQPAHPSTTLFGFITWTAADVAPLVTRQPGWVRSLVRVLWRYYSDVGQRLRSRRARFLTGGNALIARLKLALDERGVPLWLNSPLRELIVENGRVAGAWIVRDGVKVRVRARRGVILGAGGFERNGALRERFIGRKSGNPAWSAGHPCNTGDAIVEAMRLGAATRGTGNAWWAPVMSIPGEDRARPLFIERALPGAIMVDRSGRRFTNEASSYHIVGREMARLNHYEGPGAPYFMLFDSRFRARYPMGPMIPGLPDSLIPKSLRSILVKADSWDDLARKTGLPAQSLAKTISRFNDFAAKGADLDFGRGGVPYDNLFGDTHGTVNPNLGALAKPPFYAIPVYPGDISTCGGLATDQAGAVLNENGHRISGLYAVGNTAATAMGISYPGAGSTLAGGMTFAFLAAHDAVEDRTATAQPEDRSVMAPGS